MFKTSTLQIICNSCIENSIIRIRKDINKIYPDLKMKFKLSDNSDKSYDARLKSVGRIVDPNTKSIQCYADIDDLSSANFIKDAYFEAEIYTKIDTVNALPEEATLKSEGDNYILVLVEDDGENYMFKQIKIDVGRLNKGYVEILGKSGYTKILTKGAFNISI